MRKNAAVLGVHHSSHRKSTGQAHDLGRQKRSERGVVLSGKDPKWLRGVVRLSPAEVAATVATRVQREGKW